MKKFLSKTKSLFWGDEPLKGGSIFFIIITVVSTIALLTSNILAGKSFSLFGWQIGGAQLVLTLGLLCFPISYITSDLISEIYGYSASRRVSWIGFISNLFMDIMIIFGIIIPAANPYYGMVSDGLKMGFGFDFLDGGQSLGSLGILIASLLAFVIGSWVDDLVFEKLKKKAILKKDDSTKSFVFRAVGSSLMGELCDSIIFIPLLYLFTAQMGTTITNIGQLLVIVLIQATIKTLYELIVSPLTAKIAKKLKTYELNHKDEGNVIRED
jgi:hypothetical protein